MSSLVVALSPRVSAPFAATIFWAAVACCVIAQAAILRAAFARTSTPAAAVPRARRALEAAWVLLPALALAAVLVATWRRLEGGPSAARGAAFPAAGAVR